MSIGSTTAETGAARFSRHVALTLGAKVVIAAASMLAGVIIARWLDAASVGIIASLNVITLLTVTFGGIGMPSAITYLVARDRQRIVSILCNAIIFAAFAGILLGLGLVALTQIQPDLFGNIPIQLIAIVAAAVPFQLLTLFCLAVFLGLGDIKRYNIFELSTQIFLFINPFILLCLFGLGLFALVSTNAITTALISLLALPILFRAAKSSDINHKVGFDLRLLIETIRYGSKFYLAMASAVIILRADLLLVNYFRGAAEAGVYAVAGQVGTMLFMIPGVISTVLFPRVTEAREASADMTCRVTRHSALVLLAVCLAVIPAAFLLAILYGPAFSDVPFLVMILLPGVYLLGMETVQVQYFNSLGLPFAIPLFWLASMCLNITLGIIFIPLYGAYAAAVVSSISYAIMFVLVALYFRKRTGKSFSDSFLLSAEEFRILLKMHKTNTVNAE